MTGAADPDPERTQEVFETCYRDRQSALHHASYLRMGKVLLARHAMRTAGVALGGRRVFDYGFGAGTFLRHCPTSASLFGVEQDPTTVEQVAEMLRERGHARVDLRSIDVRAWRDHPLLSGPYDVFHCSHVLEHLTDPIELLVHARRATLPYGHFVGLLPLNERASDPHHLHVPDRQLVARWAEASGWDLLYYEENDPFLYWLQPLFTEESGLAHRAAQVTSLALGVPAAALGDRRWFAAGRPFARWTRSLPTQAAFVMKPT